MNKDMKKAIDTVLANIGDNKEAMKALLAAIAETSKIDTENKKVKVKETCQYVICLERHTVEGKKVYHPFVMTPPTSDNPKMHIVANAVEAQDVAQKYGMMLHDNVYAMPATTAQIKKLTDLLKDCNKRIVNAVNAAADAVGAISKNVDKDILCAEYMQNLMESCGGVIGSSMDENSKIIEKDLELVDIRRDAIEEYDGGDWDEEDLGDCKDCEDCSCECCPDHPNNNL